LIFNRIPRGVNCVSDSVVGTVMGMVNLQEFDSMTLNEYVISDTICKLLDFSSCDRCQSFSIKKTRNFTIANVTCAVCCRMIKSKTIVSNIFSTKLFRARYWCSNSVHLWCQNLQRLSLIAASQKRNAVMKFRPNRLQRGNDMTNGR